MRKSTARRLCECEKAVVDLRLLMIQRNKPHTKVIYADLEPGALGDVGQEAPLIIGNTPSGGIEIHYNSDECMVSPSVVATLVQEALSEHDQQMLEAIRRAR